MTKNRMLSKEHLLQFKDEIAAISDNGDCLKYSDLAQLSDLLSDSLSDSLSGLLSDSLSENVNRSLVFCLCQNSFGSLGGYVSFIANRAVPLLLNADLDKLLLNELITIYNPSFLWVPTKMRFEFSNFHEIFSWEDFSLLKSKSKEAIPCEFHDDLAFLFATSGSTGSPKLVRISYENMSSNAESIAEYLNITQHEKPITALPMSYSFGLSIINSHLLKGATLLLTGKSLMEKGFWNLLKEHKATSLSGVPYTFEMLTKLRFFKMDLPHLKVLTQAGGKLNIDYVKKIAAYCEESNKRFFVMYGQTEASPRMAYLPPELALTKAGSMGKAIPGGEFYLIDDNREIINEKNKVGELVYKGKNVSMGYATDRNDFKLPDMNNGVLFTGDMAKRDEDGCYYIVGRKKRFIKLFGNRVNLDDTEQILKSIISECACVGDDDKMIIYITNPHSHKLEETQKYIALKTGINHKAFSVRYIDKIPKNSSGKTLYANLAIT